MKCKSKVKISEKFYSHSP